MAEARVVRQEIDLSTRVPSFPGVFGAIVVPSKKGPVNQRVLVSEDTGFLKTFTPNESVDVGFDGSHYSALAFLEKSDSLWVIRAAADDALYGGAVVKDATAATPNYPVAAGMLDPEAFVFDAQPDVAAVAEVTRIDVAALTPAGLDGTFLRLNDTAGSVGFWFDVDDSGTVEPAGSLSLDRSIEVTTILTADADTDIATKLAAAIGADSQYSAVVENSTEVVVTDVTLEDRLDATAETSGATVTVDTQGVDEVDSTNEALLFYGANQGAWNNQVGIRIITDPLIVKEADAFIVEVYKGTTLVESWTTSRIETKKDGYNQNIYIEELLQGSEWIRAISNPAVAETVLPSAQATTLFLAQGDDGSAVTDVEMIAAADTLSNPDDVYFTVIMDGGWTTPAFHLKLDTLVSDRDDSVAVLSVPFSAQTATTHLTDTVDYRATTLNLNSSYSALYSPHVKIFDRFNDRDIFVSPDGYAAGAISESAANFEIWFPPAGFTRGLLNVTDLRRRYSSSERSVLYDAGINPLRFAPGRGILIWGQKTLQSRPSALDRLNVRLLLIVIKPAIAEALENFLFDLNNSETRRSASSVVETYMANILARQGVTDFSVVADGSNNDAADVDAGRMNLDLFIKPSIALEEIRFRTIITSQGLDFELAQELV